MAMECVPPRHPRGTTLSVPVQTDFKKKREAPNEGLPVFYRINGNHTAGGT